MLASLSAETRGFEPLSAVISDLRIESIFHFDLIRMATNVSAIVGAP